MTMLPLTAKGATVRRRGKTLVGPVDLELGPKGTTMVIGPNGAGKSLLLKMMHGLVTPEDGGILRDPSAPKLSEQAYVAAELGLSHKTVHVHRANAIDKLGVKNNVELAKLFSQESF